MSYYTAITTLTWMTLLVMCILVRENGRMSATSRRLCYVAHALIAVSALAEWCGVMLDGRAGLPAWPLFLAKWVDYTLTPIAGGAIVARIGIRNAWRKVLVGILVANVVFETIAFPLGLMVTVDAANHYTHGPLYGVYVAIYITVFAITLIQFIQYGRSFRRENRTSLYAITLLVVSGVAMQELASSDVRVAYLSLALGATLMFIHNGEFFQLARDESFDEQREQIMTDELTGSLSRRAYSLALEHLETSDMPQGLVAFSIDVNGLKEVNDTLGHVGGDRLLLAAAERVHEVFDGRGNCYRTGGDEFVVFAEMGADEADTAVRTLAEGTLDWGRGPEANRFSCGYACAADHAGLTPEQLVAQADIEMYAQKEAYYALTGRDRRRTRTVAALAASTATSAV